MEKIGHREVLAYLRSQFMGQGVFMYYGLLINYCINFHEGFKRLLKFK